MLDKIKNGLNKLKLFPEFIDVTIRQMNKQLPPNEREIVFSLDDVRLYTDWDGSGRHAFLLLNAFHEAGYNVYLYKKVGFWTYTRLQQYGRYLYGLKNLKVIASLPANTKHMIYAFDTVYPQALDRPWKRRTFVNILKSPLTKIGEVIQIPFSMHPIWYRGEKYKNALGLRKSSRSLRILFGGNTLTSYYSSPKFKGYGLLTRAEGLEAACSLTDQVKSFETRSEVDAVLEGNEYLNGCRILRTDDKTVGVQNRWLELVSKSDFFLCLSGTDLPMCHNAIEAMAVGTIPIIGYPHWFTPSLEHMKNAIVYTTKEDLIAKLKQIFAMNQEEIARLRRGVLEFYDTHLGGKNFVKRYETQNDPVNTIMLYPHFIPNSWETKLSNKAMDSLKEYFGDSVKD